MLGIQNKYQQRVAAFLLTTGLIAGSLGIQANAIDLTRSIPLEVSDYKEVSEFPAAFTTAQQVLDILNGRRNTLVHMEAVRRSYTELPPAEKSKLLTMLHDRHRALQEDPVRYFDYGYAKVVFNQNKTGLFFLRKANDALKEQFTSLAYAMGQAEIDLNVEGKDGDAVNTRKLDVEFLLKDAVKRNAIKPKKGFWPSFVREIKALGQEPAYEEILGSDHSVFLVPYGSAAIPPMLDLKAGATETLEGCSPYPTFTPNPAETEINKKLVDFDNDGQPLWVKFYQLGEQNYRMVVLNDSDGEVFNIMTPIAPHILEDLERDGQIEVVIRQYAYNMEEPVKVYRFDGCQFSPDEEIQEYFQ